MVVPTNKNHRLNRISLDPAMGRPSRNLPREEERSLNRTGPARFLNQPKGNPLARGLPGRKKSVKQSAKRRPIPPRRAVRKLGAKLAEILPTRLLRSLVLERAIPPLSHFGRHWLRNMPSLLPEGLRGASNRKNSNVLKGTSVHPAKHHQAQGR